MLYMHVITINGIIYIFLHNFQALYKEVIINMIFLYTGMECQCFE